MLSIGLIGKDDVLGTMEMLRYLFEKENRKVIIKNDPNMKKNLKEDLKKDTEADVLIEYIDKNTDAHKNKFTILIVNEKFDYIDAFLNEMSKNDFVLINSDVKELCKATKGCQSRLISYGLNSKASITASSVEDGAYKTILLCIQRNLPTLKGQTAAEQEFSVKIKDSDKSLSGIMAAISALILCDIPIDTLNSCVFL